MNIVPFNFKNNNLRTIFEEGEIWFVGKDVCDILGYTNVAQALNNNCRGVSKRYTIPDSLGRPQETRVINEPDMYRLVVKSTLPAAEEFEAWVFEEVLPTIRKTGGYQLAPVETVYQKQIMLAKAAAEMLRLSDSSKLLMLNKIAEGEGVPKQFLPAYVQQPLARSLTSLLKSRGSSLNVRTANLALVDMGFVREEVRTGQSGTTKKFKTITEEGAIFGHNEVSPNNPRESQPLYHESTFDELLDLIVKHLSQEE
jgi:prophage antirepressor-like protein